jgi:hypothetical protein
MAQAVSAKEANPEGKTTLQRSIQLDTLDDANRETHASWKQYYNEKNRRGHTKKIATLADGWGPDNPDRYRDLTRLQSVALFRIRSNVTNLFEQRYKMKVGSELRCLHI